MAALQAGTVNAALVRRCTKTDQGFLLLGKIEGIILLPGVFSRKTRQNSCLYLLKPLLVSNVHSVFKNSNTEMLVFKRRFCSKFRRLIL